MSENGQEDLVVELTVRYRPRDGNVELTVAPAHMLQRGDVIRAALHCVDQVLVMQAVQRAATAQAQARLKPDEANAVRRILQ